MMRWIERVRRRFGLSRPHRDVEGEVEAELRFHMTAYAEDLMRRGHSEDDARRKAQREFGDVTAARAELVEIDLRRARRAGRKDVLLDVRQDVRFAMRMMLRRPAFTMSAVVMLALGIGATTAIFSVVDTALLRPLPFEDPDRLAVIWGVAGPERDIRGGSYPEIRDWEELTRSFSDVSIYDETSLNLSGGGGEAERLEAEFVSPGYFRLLGVSPRLGRGFTEDDDRPGVEPSVLISHSLWQRRFGGAPDILGRGITLDDRPAVIVGVMPEGFRGFSFDTELWATLLPFVPDAIDDRGRRWLAAIGRLGPGVTVEAAQTNVVDAARQLEERHPGVNRERSADLFSLHQYYLDATRTLLLVLLGAVALLLLIACVNVVNLQLVRGIARGAEVALRYALGAGKLRLVRQLMTDAPGVAIVSEAFARRLWPGRDPVGQHIQIGPDADDDRARVIGVAGNVRFRNLTTDLMDPGEDPDVYFSYAQVPTGSFDVLVRSATSELTRVDIVPSAVAALDASVPLARVQPLEDALAAQTANARFGSLVLGIFAILALALSAIGLYGVMAFVVASRRREIAIRIALGAEPARMLRMVVRQGMALVAIGAAIGIGTALLSARLFSSLLYGVQPSDPAAITAVTAILHVTAALANAVPALRAVRTEPQSVLRGDYAAGRSSSAPATRRAPYRPAPFKIASTSLRPSAVHSGGSASLAICSVT